MSAAEGGLTRRTITGMLWAVWGKGAHAGLQLLVLAVMARLVSATDFGVVSAALIVIGFSAIFSQLGFGPALVQRPELEQRYLNTAFTSSVLFGLLLWMLEALRGFLPQRLRRIRPPRAAEPIGEAS